VQFRYLYDDLGQLTKVIDSTGIVIDYVYDPVGNILQIKRSSVAPGTAAIFNFTPQLGTLGQTVTIQGQAFDPTPANNIVQFNGTTAPVLSALPTTITVKVPDGATTGPISVTVGGQTATSTNNFTVIVPPAITGMSCKSALFNKVIPNLQVSGTNLNGATFAFASATGFPAVNIIASSVDPSGTSAILSLQVGAQAGTFALVATNLAGSSSTLVSPSNRFTVVNPLSKADTSEDGFSDVVKAEFCADPLDPNSIPDIPQGMAIQTVEDLQNMANNLAGNYHLANDIDASGTATWNAGIGFLPIGSSANPFTGTLNGNGHIITSLFINSAATNIGLFGSAAPAAFIENVDLVQANITGTGGGAETGATGALVGHLDGQVTNCTVSGSVIGTSTDNFVGGLVGLSDGNINNSSAVVTVSAPGFGSAGGGLVGINTGNVTNSTATGTVGNTGQGGGMGGLVGENEPPGLILNSQASANASGNSTVNGSVIGVAGGLVGFNSATIRHSRATGAVSGLNESFVGGLVGANGAGGVIQQSLATGSVNNGLGGPGGSGGGLVGLNLGDVEQSVATGPVNNSGTGGNGGGLVGANELTGTITKSYATGTVSGNSLSGIGGLVGFNGDDSSQISQSYSIGAVVGPNATCAGGLVGCDPAGTTAAFSYWDTQTSRQPTSATGIGETTAQLQSGTLLTGFDPTVWAAQPGIYPHLIWLGPAPVTVVLTSSQNPSAPGQSVTFAAAVAPVLSNATLPTGIVTFLDGENAIGTGTLNTGVVTFTTSTLALGSHNITASYGGDGSFNSGTGLLSSNPQVVTQIPIPAPTVTPPPPPIIAIQTVQDLQNMANNLTGNYHLANDIDASVTATWNGGQGFLPIGSSVNPFTGTLNGNGHIITALFINSGATDVGLFGSVDPAALIENVNLAQVNITGTGGGQETGGTGALVGRLDGQVTNCTLSGSVTGTSTGNFVGGLVGISDGTISNSSAVVTVSASGSGSAGGGLVGINVGTVTNSIASGTIGNPGQGGGMGGLVGENEPPGLIVSSQASANVSGNSTTNGSVIAAVGGLVGFNSAMIQQSRATGEATGTNASFVGGLVGANAAGGVIQQSFATGAAQNGSGGSGGGLVGLNLGSIQQSLATGPASNASTGGNEGGLVGANELTGTITQSYATGTVSGNAQSGIGGLVGFNGDDSPQISQSYSVGTVVESNASCAGGLVGCDPAETTAASSYWDAQTSGQPNSATGIGETTAQLQSGTLPEGFDQTFWAAKPGHYPYLIWLGPAPVIVTVTSSQNPASLRQSLTFTATVSSVLPGAASPPSGTVTFLDGGHPIGMGNLSGGVATLTTSALTLGVHTITASYEGDGTFSGGTSSLTGNPQVVNPSQISRVSRSTQRFHRRSIHLSSLPRTAPRSTMRASTSSRMWIQKVRPSSSPF
jgi:YD repeat-containing protein